jgi:hypothetical protein
MSVHLVALQELWHEYFQPAESPQQRPSFPYSEQAMQAMAREIAPRIQGKSCIEAGKIVGEELAKFNPPLDEQTSSITVCFLLHTAFPSDEHITSQIARKQAWATATGTIAEYTNEEIRGLQDEALLLEGQRTGRSLTREERAQALPFVMTEIMPLVLPGRISKPLLQKVLAATAPRRTQTDRIKAIVQAICSVNDMKAITGADREHVFTMAQFVWQSKMFSVLTHEQRSNINTARRILTGSFLQRIGIMLQNFFQYLRNLFATPAGLSESEQTLVTNWLNALEDRIWPRRLDYTSVVDYMRVASFEESVATLLKGEPIKDILSAAKTEFDRLVLKQGDSASPAFKALPLRIEAIMHELAATIAHERAQLEKVPSTHKTH